MHFHKSLKIQIHDFALTKNVTMEYSIFNKVNHLNVANVKKSIVLNVYLYSMLDLVKKIN